MKLLKETKFDDIISEYISDLKDDLPDVFSIQNIEDIETESYPGYSPYSHNQGGYQLRAFADLGSFFGSGEHYRTYASEFIEYLIERDRKSLAEHYDGYDKLDDEAKLDAEYESLSDDSNSVYLEVMMMFSDKDERGVYTLSVNAYLEGSDAPYHRGCDFKFETEIRFKTASGLKRQLKRLKSKLQMFIMCKPSKASDFEAVETRHIYQYQIRKPMSEIVKGA
jgi:hypothetical protein